MQTLKLVPFLLFGVAIVSCSNGNSSAPVDTTPPAVASVSPASNASDVAVNSIVTATFSETLNAATITGATFTLSGGVTGVVTYTGTTATFTPSADLAYNTTYTATITTGIQDAAGNAMNSPYSWTFTTSRPPAGTLDTSFGVNGYAIVDITFGADNASAVAIQSDGKLVVAGNVNGNTTPALVRLNVDGTLDTSFGQDGKVVVTNLTGLGNSPVQLLAIQPDDKILISGRINNTCDVARFTKDGAIDTTFGNNGVLEVNFTVPFCTNTQSIVALSDGSILLSGSQSAANPNTFLNRYLSTGAQDPSFNSGGPVNPDCGACSIASGQVVGGKTTLVGRNGAGKIVVARHNWDGSVDVDFGTGGRVVTNISGSSVAAALQTDEKVVVAGYDFALNFARVPVGRLLSNGSPDVSFGAGGSTITSYGVGGFDGARAMTVQPDGKILILADDNSVLGGVSLLRFNADGTPDSSFSDAYVDAVPGRARTPITNGYSMVRSDEMVIVVGGNVIEGDDAFYITRIWL